MRSDHPSPDEPPGCPTPATGADAPARVSGDAPAEVAASLEEAAVEASSPAEEPEERTVEAASATASESAVETVPPAPEPMPESPPTVVDVEDLDWAEVRRASTPAAVRARMRGIVERMEALLDAEAGPEMLFDADRARADDRAIHVTALEPEPPLWFIGDLHGDLLGLEAALALVRHFSGADAAPSAVARGGTPRLVFLGDLFDDGGDGLEVLLRVFELIAEGPGSVCVVAGNHDEALRFDGARFSATVSPSDFSEFLNEHLAHEWVTRAGKLAVRLFERAPRALFFPDGLLVAHGGFPLADLHADLAASGDWNDPRCLQDFVWTRAHARARRKIPNRVSRGSQFGHEDFAAFCALSAELGRSVERMVRGHDHVEDGYAAYPAYAAHPLLTIVSFSRRLPRDPFGAYVRVPAVARWMPGAVPEVYRLHVPEDLVRERYPDPDAHGAGEGADERTSDTSRE